jgi:hypothetical protein
MEIYKLMFSPRSSLQQNQTVETAAWPIEASRVVELNQRQLGAVAHCRWGYAEDDHVVGYVIATPVIREWSRSI